MRTRENLMSIVLENLEEKVVFFQNSKQELMVHVPEDRYQQDWSTDSERILDLLCIYFYDVSLGKYLRKREREQMLSLIRQKCRSGKRCYFHYKADVVEDTSLTQEREADDISENPAVSSGCRQDAVRRK